MARAQVITHDPNPENWETGLGHLAEVLEELGFAISINSFVTNDAPPDNPVNLLVVLGSSHSVRDETLNWLSSEKAFVKSHLHNRTPTLGICFGSQLLAHLLGGSIEKSSSREVGFKKIASTRPDLIPIGPWFHLHGEEFVLPDKAVLLAQSDISPQAFLSQQAFALALQFHLEANPRAIELMLSRASVSPDLKAQILETADESSRRLYEDSLRVVTKFLHHSHST